jgi:UDP:flavonoid glycosyltransferase YjiC (YdhE family)
VTDNRVLWDLDARSINALFGEALNANRASIGLPPVENVRDYVVGDQPWLATDPTLDPRQERPDLNVVQTGAWILPDVRPLPDDLEAFLDAGTPPVYVGFGSMPMRTSTDVAQVAIEAIRAQGRRAVVARGWADLAPTGTTASSSARSTIRHSSAGWPPSCTTAARGRRRRPPGPALLRWWYPRRRTTPTGPAG